MKKIIDIIVISVHKDKKNVYKCYLASHLHVVMTKLKTSYIVVLNCILINLNHCTFQQGLWYVVWTYDYRTSCTDKLRVNTVTKQRNFRKYVGRQQILIMNHYRTEVLIRCIIVQIYSEYNINFRSKTSIHLVILVI